MILLGGIANLVFMHTNGFQGSQTFVLVLEAILLSRFFLNLRSAADGLAEAPSSPSGLQVSIQQSFGGEVIFGDNELVEDDGEPIIVPVDYGDAGLAARDVTAHIDLYCPGTSV
ncbi:hypothetical protein FOMPIDRAFT_1055846 [Fomitopsis schrenkii]|uniref:Uncharacterized protein n=1 Tax=Fomitopsis schrenkii TaxID=2126942 RepID=S8EV74_FOMSC|nr:hypothetical protein FOMPIDRAFT_1055846 [Fomitopsis schrenkii]